MMESGRLEAFSDGVFAVAITLLALHLAVPGPGHGPLARQLVGHWPSFTAYVISFLTIGIIWVNHHMLQELLRDRPDAAVPQPPAAVFRRGHTLCHRHRRRLPRPGRR